MYGKEGRVKPLVEMMANKTSKAEMTLAIIAWVNQNESLSRWLGHQNVAVKNDFISTLLGKPKFAELFDGRLNRDDVTPILGLIESSGRKFSEISNQYLSNVLGITQLFNGYPLRQICTRVYDLQKSIDLDLDKMQIPAEYFKIFRYLNSMLYDRYDAKRDPLANLFSLMQRQDIFDQLERVTQDFTKEGIKQFFSKIIQEYSIESLEQISGYNATIMENLPYLLLIEDVKTPSQMRDALELPHVKKFIDLLREHNALTKEYAYSKFATSSRENYQYLDFYSWNTDMIKRYSELHHGNDDLLSMFIRMVDQTEGSAIRSLEQYLMQDTMEGIKTMCEMLFIYPKYLEEFEYFHRWHGHLYDNFISFKGYSDVELAKRILKGRPDLSLFYLREKNSAKEFNRLNESGALTLLFNYEKGHKNLSYLSAESSFFSDVESDFGKPKLMVYACQKEFLNGDSLLKCLLDSDPLRYEVIIRFMSIAKHTYRWKGDSDNLVDAVKALSDDMISSGLMEKILSAPLPKHFVEAGFDPERISDTIGHVFENNQLAPFSNEFKLFATSVALDMFGLTIEVFAPLVHENESMVNEIPDFVAERFVATVNKIKDARKSASQMFSEGPEQVEKFCLENSERFKAIFEEMIKEKARELYQREAPDHNV